MSFRPAVLPRFRAFLRSCLRWDRAFARHIVLLALPMVVQDLTAASLHIIDGVMVSGLGDTAYSAVLQSNRFTFVFQLFIFGISTGAAIFLSQYWGIRDIRRMRHAMGLALGVALLIALLFSGAAMLFPRQIIGCFLPAGESFELAVEYLLLVAPSYVLLALSNVYAVTIKAAEKPHLPMLAGIAGIVANTFLNYVLIYGNLGFPAMGVKGAAIGTVMATGITLFVNLAFAYGKRLPAGARPRELVCRDIAFIGSFLQTAAPVVLNEGLWGLGSTMFSVFYGKLGDVSIAAVGVNGIISDLVWVFIMSLTSASAILVGKTLGQGDKERAYLYAKRLLAGGAIMGLALGLGLTILHAPLVNLFSGLSQAARDKAGLILLLASPFLWIRAVNCINVVGLLRAGGDTMFSLALDAGTMWFIAVPATGIAALILHWPIEYVVLCTLLDEITKLAVGMPHFRKRKWMNVLTGAKEDSSLGSS